MLRGGMAERICEEARFADLVIVGQYETEGSPERHPSSLADDVVVNCGRPLIVIPPGDLHFPKLGRVLCAYDGSREAVRAIHDALPLLQTAGSEVDVLSDANGISQRAELMSHLARHDLAVRNWIEVRVVGRSSDELVDQSVAAPYDLLVMGAYGRPIWREFLFGGTTKSMLLRADLPVFLSH
jgi:nucleotide-binding universal stress UspA family protein